MARDARKRAGIISRREYLLGGLAIPLSRAFAVSSPLTVTWDGDDLHVTAPRLHFLTGKPLERLKNGDSVVFITQLSLSTDNFATVMRRAPQRFVFSFDLWEEKFSVSKMEPGPRHVAGLPANAAEAWCVENVAIGALGLASNRPFWLRFELRAAEPKDEAAVLGEPGLNLNRLIEMFSRLPRAEQPHWSADAGPLRLADLTRVRGRAFPSV